MVKAAKVKEELELAIPKRKIQVAGYIGLVPTAQQRSNVLLGAT
jgi:hypothetical protein